jgi:hypothetical protein
MNKVRPFFTHYFLEYNNNFGIFLGIVVFEAGGDSGVFEINIMNDLCNERFMKYLQLTLSVPGKITYYVYYTYVYMCINIYVCILYRYVYIYMYNYTCIHMYVYNYIYKHIPLYIHVYIIICIHKYIGSAGLQGRTMLAKVRIDDDDFVQDVCKGLS